MNKQAREFAQQKIAEQRRREERKLLELQKGQESQREEAKLKESQLREEEELRNRQKNKRLHNLQLKAIKRKENAKNLQTFANQCPKTTPLYRIIEKTYTEQVETLELERRNEELRKLKDFYSPMKHEELQQHMKIYQYHRDESELKRALNKEKNSGLKHLPYSQYNELLEAQRQEKKEQSKYRDEIHSLVNKRSMYSKLIMDMYRPRIDPSKQREMEFIRNRLAHPVQRKIYSKQLSISVISERKKTAKPKQKSSQGSKREQLKIDYLEEKRQLRKEMEEKLFRNPSNLKAREVYRQEKLLRHLTPQEYFNESTIQAEAKINDMLVDSIKSKVALLVDYND